MEALRRYLSHYCRCDDATIARHLAAEAAGSPLPLPELADWCRLSPNLGLFDLIAQQARLIAVERMASGQPVEGAAPTTPVSSPSSVPVAAAATGWAAEMRRGRIIGSIPARCRPTLAARLAADATISVEAAIHTLAHAPIEADLATAFPEAGPDAPLSSGFGPSFEAMPQSAAEKATADLEQFKAIARALPAGDGGSAIRIRG